MISMCQFTISSTRFVSALSHTIHWAHWTRAFMKLSELVYLSMLHARSAIKPPGFATSVSSFFN